MWSHWGLSTSVALSFVRASMVPELISICNLSCLCACRLMNVCCVICFWNFPRMIIALQWDTSSFKSNIHEVTPVNSFEYHRNNNQLLVSVSTKDALFTNACLSHNSEITQMFLGLILHPLAVALCYQYQVFLVDMTCFTEQSLRAFEKLHKKQPGRQFGSMWTGKAKHVDTRRKKKRKVMSEWKRNENKDSNSTVPFLPNKGQRTNSARVMNLVFF